MIKLIIHSQDSLRFVSYTDISHCKSDNCYTTVFLQDGEELVMCKSLKKVYEELNPDIFVRVNQSYVVNKNYVRLIDKKNKLIELVNRKKIPFTTTVSGLIDLISSGATLIAIIILHAGIANGLITEML